MKIVRFAEQGTPRYGIVEGDTVYRAEGDLFGGTLSRGAEVGTLDGLSFLPPVAPSKIVAVGLNYAAHVAEMAARASDPSRAQGVHAEPVIFLKPPTALIGQGQAIEMLPGYRTDFEAELCIVMGKQAFRVAEDEALDYVLGYTCGNDVSNREVGGGGQWTRGKGYNTFCPLGPVIATDLDPHHLRIQLRLNGEIRQNTTTETMIFKPATLISFIANVMTLYPGDVIMTGTPEGVGALQPGDTIEVEIEGIGTLHNPVTARQP